MLVEIELVFLHCILHLREACGIECFVSIRNWVSRRRLRKEVCFRSFCAWKVAVGGTELARHGGLVGGKQLSYRHEFRMDLVVRQVLIQKCMETARVYLQEF